MRSERSRRRAEPASESPARRDQWEALAIYRRLSQMEPSPPRVEFPRRSGFNQKVDAIDEQLGADIFKADCRRVLLADVAPGYEWFCRPTPDEYLGSCFAVRFAEYRALVEEEFGAEHAISWAASHGAKEVERMAGVCALEPKVLEIWQALSADTVTTAPAPDPPAADDDIPSPS